jgi:hypothetical protein
MLPAGDGWVVVGAGNADHGEHPETTTIPRRHPRVVPVTCGGFLLPCAPTRCPPPAPPPPGARHVGVDAKRQRFFVDSTLS